MNNNKTYYTRDNIGKAKYTVSHYDGVKTHKDGSPFFDIFITKNKVVRDRFIAGLINQGYSLR